jgi:uncharacterized protein YjaG (DUF416 family)
LIRNTSQVTVNLLNTSQAGEDVTDQIIRMKEGMEKNTHVQMKLLRAEGMGGGNRAAQPI